MNKDGNKRSHCNKTIAFKEVIGKIGGGGRINLICNRGHGKHNVDKHL
jgi:hypothetical protein